MKEIPILFSTPMVLANLDDRKTMTRRLINIDDLKKNPDAFRYAGNSNEIDFCRPAIKYDDRVWYQWELKNSNAQSWIDRCKYKVGDLLWVRETFGYEYGGGILYKASHEHMKKVGGLIEHKWKPSIFMPKTAARIWLQVTDIRVERLQDISEQDAIAEGVEQNRDGSWHDYLEPLRLYQDDAKASFISLWMKINGTESWEASPWVWVISYKILSKTGKPDLQNP